MSALKSGYQGVRLCRAPRLRNLSFLPTMVEGCASAYQIMSRRITKPPDGGHGGSPMELFVIVDRILKSLSISLTFADLAEKQDMYSI